VPVEHTHSARLDVTQLSDEALERMILQLSAEIGVVLRPEPPAMPVLQLAAEAKPPLTQAVGS
jgi:hypothetical protein